jgi:hypothetical protein
MKKILVTAVLFLVISASDVFAQFYKQPVCEFDVDFSNSMGIILHYFGFRPREKEFIEAVHTGFFPYFIDPDEILMPPSYRRIENNTALDERIKTLMRKNKITVCITGYPNDYDGFIYIVNYSFDNYKTFGFVSMDSTRK